MISIILVIGIMLSFCGCKKMNANESNFSSGYITLTDKDTGKINNSSTDDIKDFNTTTEENDTASTVTSSTYSKVETIKPSTDKKPTSSSDVSSTIVSTPTTSSNTEKSSESSYSTELTPLTAAEIKQVEDYFFQLVNEERARIGVQPLTRNATLDKAAKIRVDELLKEYSHTRPNGTNYFTVLTELKYGTPHEDIWSDDGVNWNTTISYDYGASAENLAGDYNTSATEILTILYSVASYYF